MVRSILKALAIPALLCLATTQAPADELAIDLTGTWRGDAVFLLPAGKTDQEHSFVFEQSEDGFLTGEHAWNIPAKNLKSNDGKSDTFSSAEPFLGVIGSDGEIWLVEDGDLTMFKLHMMDAATIEFIALEGGAHALVGRGTLTRQ